MKVFLGGTCNESTWRDELIPLLKIDYFNLVVEDWTREAQENELKEREECDYCLYVITPQMEGFYSIAEAVDDSNKRPKKTVLLFKEVEAQEHKCGWHFTKKQLHSIEAVKRLVASNGGKVCESLEGVAEHLNSQADKPTFIEGDVD